MNEEKKVFNLEEKIKCLRNLDNQAKEIAEDVSFIKKEIKDAGFNMVAINNLLKYYKDEEKYLEDKNDTEKLFETLDVSIL